MSLQEWTLRESHRLTCVSQAEGGEEEDPQGRLPSWAGAGSPLQRGSHSGDGSNCDISLELGNTGTMRSYLKLGDLGRSPRFCVVEEVGPIL